MRVSCLVPYLALSAFAHGQTEAPKPTEREPGLYAIVETSHGSIVFRLYEDESPATVKNFVDLATGRKSYTDPRTHLPSRRPFYNGLTFHRVIPQFMIQGGDPLEDGTGGTKEIPDEFHDDLKFDRAGRVGMANSGPNTGSCQFFITEAATPHLDGLHTIFGQVVEGQEVVEEIARVPRDEEDKPLSPVTIKRVGIQRVAPR